MEAGRGRGGGYLNVMVCFPVKESEDKSCSLLEVIRSWAQGENVVALKKPDVLNYSKIIDWALGNSCVKSTLHHSQYCRVKLQGGIKGITFFASVIWEMS